MPEAATDLVRTLSRESMPSRDKVIKLDLEPVSFDLGAIPLDDVLEFRMEHGADHRAYMRDLRSFMAELAAIDNSGERENVLLQRRQEIADAGPRHPTIYPTYTRQELGIVVFWDYGWRLVRVRWRPDRLGPHRSWRHFRARSQRP